MASAAAATRVEVGTKVSKDAVYLTSERWFAEHGRGMVAGKGGSRQRRYFCDQSAVNKCPAFIRWTVLGYVGKRRKTCANNKTSATAAAFAGDRLNQF